MNKQAKLEEFRRSMTAQAESELAHLQSELDAVRAAQDAQARARAEEGETAHIAKAREEAAHIVRQATARAAQDARNTLLLARERFTEGVFEAAQEKIQRFVSSEQYEAYLCRCVSRLAAAVAPDGATLYLRPADKHLAEQLQKQWPGKIQQDNTIQLGGAKAVNPSQGLCADETLDSALEQQRDWFRMYAGVPFVEGGET